MVRALLAGFVISASFATSATAGGCWPCYSGWYPVYAVQSCYPVAAGLSYEPSGVIYNRPDCYGAVVTTRRAREIRALFPPPPPHYRLDLRTGAITLQSPW